MRVFLEQTGFGMRPCVSGVGPARIVSAPKIKESESAPARTLRLPQPIRERAYCQRNAISVLRAKTPCAFISSVEITADMIGTRSVASVRNVLDHLSKTGWVESRKGRGGGYRLSEAARFVLA